MERSGNSDRFFWFSRWHSCKISNRREETYTGDVFFTDLHLNIIIAKLSILVDEPCT